MVRITTARFNHDFDILPEKYFRLEGGDGYEGKGGEEEGDLGWIKYSTETPYVPHQASTLAQGP